MRSPIKSMSRLVPLWARHAGKQVAEIDQALAKGQFKPYFQAIFELQTGAILGCEILARWILDDGSVISPQNFVSVAETSGRLRLITWHLLKQALLDLQTCLRSNRDFKLSINIAPSQLMDDDFLYKLRSIVDFAEVPARKIVLEITEGARLCGDALAAEVVKKLRDFDFQVAIDDVGIGYSLSHLKTLGATTMKIDKFFVDAIASDISSKGIVEMLVRLANDLKMSVVAEGIETAEQVRTLIACGVDVGQGYLVSRPVPIREFVELLSRNSMRPTWTAAVMKFVP